MDELKKIWEKHKKLIIIGIVFVCLLPLIIVHLLFKWKSGVSFIEAEWSAGDLLGYLGTIFSFVGTIVLGFLALGASIKANDLSQKVIKLEEERYKLDVRPFVLVSDWKLSEINTQELFDSPKVKYIQVGNYQSGKALGLTLELTNTTESFVSVVYMSGRSEKPEKSWTNATVNQQNVKMMLPPGAKDIFVFYAEPAFMKGLEHQCINISLLLENRFSKQYREEFKLHITSIFDNVYPNTGKWYCRLIAQEYEIFRYDKDENGNTQCIKEQM